MSSFNDKEVRKSLKKKGFKEHSDNDHIYLWYYNQDKITKIKTKVSHNGQDINDSLIGLMAKQTQLSNTRFKELVQCTLSKEGYKKILLDKSLIQETKS